MDFTRYTRARRIVAIARPVTDALAWEWIVTGWPVPTVGASERDAADAYAAILEHVERCCCFGTGWDMPCERRALLRAIHMEAVRRWLAADAFNALRSPAVRS